MSKEPAIDKKVMATLKEIMAEDFEALIPVFYSSFDEIMSELETAYVEANLEDFLRQAHSLKSSCANLGCLVLRDLASALELQAKQGQIPDSLQFLPVLREEFARVQLEMAEYTR
ncbi:MAG: HPt (histidine-containing phosphotransfer) domain-containing protein [Planctomycetota bacterium]|jgi:HPt (histidine-containing phosphotransfer) domain-containing protein